MAVGGDVRRHSWIIKIIKLILCLMYKCKYFYRRVSVGKFIDIFFVMADNTDTEVFGEKEGVIESIFNRRLWDLGAAHSTPIFLLTNFCFR